MLKTKDLYDLTHTRAASLLENTVYPWEALAKIKEFILEIGPQLPKDEFDEVSENVWIAKDAVIYPNNYIGAPCIIGHKTEVRPCAFVRGSALVGDNCVVGNSTELKNVILFDNVQVPHYNYVGDSILGYKSHMGAGSITSNVKSDKLLVTVKCGDEKIETGLKAPRIRPLSLSSLSVLALTIIIGVLVLSRILRQSAKPSSPGSMTSSSSRS